MRKKKISVRDIAAECGVAVGTVSRVINRRPGVRADLRQRVEDAIRRYNYNPYHGVPIVDKVRARTLKVVMPYYTRDTVFQDGFYAKAVEGIRQTVLDKGYEMTITGEHTFDEGLLAAGNGPDFNGTAAGVVFVCPQRNWNEMIGLAQNRNIPCALVNRTTIHRGVMVVREKSRAEMIRQMVAHLARRGRRTIFCLNPPQGNIIFNRENFKQALAATGLACDESHILTSTHSSDLLAGLHHDRRMPDAFFCFDDMSAINTMKDLQHLGYRIPEQVAVVGYNNIEVSRYVTPELTTIDNHIDQMTGLAAKLLIEKIEGSGYQDLEVEIEGELVIRASCGSNVKAAR